MRPVQIYTAVDAIARCGSIRRAAERLAISPSALNRQILGLESELGLDLFDRLPGGVRLSTAGEVYIRAFRDHLGDLKRIESLIADLSGQRTGTVRIGVGPELSTIFLPRLVGAYRQQFPLVNFCLEVVRYDQLSEQVLSGQIDVAVAVEPVLVPGLVAVATEEAEIVAVSGPEAGVQDMPLSFGDLAQCSLVVPTQASGLRNNIDAAFAGRRVQPRYTIETDTAVTQRLMQDPEMLWITPTKNVDQGSLEDSGMIAHRIASRTLPEVKAQVLHRDHRALPVAVSGVLGILALELAA
ncbi:MAG: LysR family transcriptional regulator [Pseudomonadota bacterium]